MTDSTKTILTVVGVGAGLYIVYKLVTPSATPLSLNPFGTTNVNTTAAASGNFFGGLLGGLLKPASGPLPVTPAASGGGASPVAAGGYVDPSSGLYYATPGSQGVIPPWNPTAGAPTVPAGFDTNNYTTSDGFMYTDDTGSFVAG